MVNKWELLQFSQHRGDLHVLGNEFVETDPLQVVANNGAALMNAALYERRFTDNESEEIVKTSEKINQATTLAFSIAPDRFIYASEEDRSDCFDLIADSYEQNGIYISRNYIRVDDIDDIDYEATVLPRVLSKAVAGAFGEDAEPQVKYYRKDHHQKLWEREGVPTPQTAYMSRDALTGSAGDWEEYVVNGVDGSGGYNMLFVPREKVLVTANMFLEEPSIDVVQIQGKLPLKGSPSMIGNISNSQVYFVNGMEQRFKAPGSYGGSEWTDQYIPKQHSSVYYPALKALQKEGVRGQVNIDMLLTEDDEVFAREVNTRPGSSAVVNRFREADINGEHPTRIHLLNNIKTDRPDTILTLGHDNLRTLLYNYHEEVASVAFMGVGTTREEMISFEQEVLSNL